MAAVNLPDNPANGTTQTVGGITYTYNSSKGYWTAASSGGGGGGGASVSTSDAAPSSPSGDFGMILMTVECLYTIKTLTRVNGLK